MIVLHYVLRKEKNSKDIKDGQPDFGLRDMTLSRRNSIYLQ